MKIDVIFSWTLPLLEITPLPLDPSVFVSTNKIYYNLIFQNCNWKIIRNIDYTMTGPGEDFNFSFQIIIFCSDEM